MRKNTIKAFTLVEMLIVIVIIGILIASLMPRMQTAQGRARDVARKNDLSQIQTAIITSQSDRGAWPGMNKNGSAENVAKTWIPVSEIKDQLIAAWMSEVPKDPNGSNVNYWFWETNDTRKAANKWEYIYMVGKRNWVNNAWFALMAKTEVEWSSNWVVCNNAGADSNWKGLSNHKWAIWFDDDLSTITLCSNVTQHKGETDCSTENPAECIYNETAELRYLLLY